MKFRKSSLRTPSSLRGFSMLDPSTGASGGCGIMNMSWKTLESSNIMRCTGYRLFSIYSIPSEGDGNDKKEPCSPGER
jgi:hypothetical protein